MSSNLSKPQPIVHEFAATGVAGLDDILRGGFTSKRLYLVEGVPGSGKTTLAMQFLIEGVKRGESVLFVSLSESEEELRQVADSHGWSLDGITIRELIPSEGNLRPDEQYTMFHPSEVELSETTKAILADVDRIQPTRLVFDSLSELRLLAGNPLRYRRQILALKQFFAGKNCTVLLLDDLTSNDRDLQVQSIAHGVVRLEQLYPEYGAERRRLLVVKYRGVRFRGGYHDYLIQRGGLEVFPRLIASEHRTEMPMQRLQSKIAELDTLLGGGIERGTSTLIVGAPGSGKSTLAAQFCQAAAEQGQHASLFIFDESINTLLTRTVGLGIDLKKHIDAGRITIQQIDPAELSPGEFAHAIRSAVEKQQAAVVVIDSLNGYLNAMPEERFLTIQLHEMLSFLGRAGVATLLLSAHQGLIGGPMVSPVDASYLADAVILLRYFESRGEVRQAISVVKKRAGAHERSIREYKMEDGRIRVGPPLREFRGVLTGVPVFESSSEAKSRKRTVSQYQPHNLEGRLVLLAPTQKDVALTRSILEDDHVTCVACSSLSEVCHELNVGVAVLMLAEENILQEPHDELADWLRRQPPWSDLPIIVVARPGADSAAVAQAMDLFGNVTVLERPTRIAALVSAVRSARRARERQYQIRAHLLESERELAAQAMLGAIVASSDDAIISKNLDGIVQTWNAGAERLFGYTAEEMIGCPITRIIPPERQAEEPALLERLRRGERIEHFETVRIRKDGRRLDISLTVSPIRNSQGKVIGASKVARDITERKQAEADLREADRRKDEFLATLAHELRNPLAPIRNSLHILRMTACNDPAAERVCEMMERQVNHMVRLVDDLMELSRITRGLIELRKEHTDLATIIRMSVETSKPLIAAANHQLTITIPGEPIPLYVDGARLAQVFANLLNNAAKYTEPDGQIWLTGRLDGSEVVIAVRDNGIGISTEQLPVVFEMFMQADRSNSRSQGGLGIGLTLVRKLVEMHGGTVTADSPGASAGSEFVVRLPVAIDNLQDTPRQPLLERGALPPRRVLVVDDNVDAATSLAMLLKLLGIEVKTAHDGPTALVMIEKYHPDVVLLDIGMPEMDGIEVARQIRQRSEFDDILLVALTGWGQEDDRRQTKKAGFDNHLVKPADIAALQSLLMSPRS